MAADRLARPPAAPRATGARWLVGEGGCPAGAEDGAPALADFHVDMDVDRDADVGPFGFGFIGPGADADLDPGSPVDGPATARCGRSARTMRLPIPLMRTSSSTVRNGWRTR